MDSSVAGKPPGILPIEGWGHQPPATGANPVEPGQSVNPSRDPQHLRDKHKDDTERKSADSAESKDRAKSTARGNLGGSEDDTPDIQTNHTYLQAVDSKTGQVSIQSIDPATGQVFWQAPLPADPFQDPGKGHHGSSASSSPSEDDNPQSAGLLGKRAYEHRDDDRDSGPRIVKTA
mgnify:FL=1